MWWQSNTLTHFHLLAGQGTAFGSNPRQQGKCFVPTTQPADTQAFRSQPQDAIEVALQTDDGCALSSVLSQQQPKDLSCC